MEALLSRWEMIKKDKHGKHCHNKGKQFSPFFLSVDGMLGRKALVVLLKLSQVMAAKRVEPLLQVRGWVNGKISIEVVRAYSQIISRDQLPSPLWEIDLDWDPESGIGLAG